MTKQQKVILFTALKTLAATAAAALLAFSIWILCAPQTMATASEKAGNYSFAVTCANLRYSYTKNAEDLARCAEDGILSGKDKYIVEYGEKFISDEKFEEVCKKKEYKLVKDYKSYICGNVAAAQYRRGDLDKAIATADKPEKEDGFIKLTLTVAERGSAEDKQKLKTALAENGYDKLANIIENTGD